MCDEEVETETVSEIPEPIKNEDLQDPENEESASNIQEETVVLDNEKESKSDETQEDIGGPPSVDATDANESRWCDNYSFADDEKPGIDFTVAEAKDPEKLILWAAEKNELETLRELLEKDPNLVNARDNDLYTPLHRASYSNNVEVIKILLSCDADISAKTLDGWQPLHCACKWDSVEAVSLLIQNGADVNAQTNGHISPLHLAASNVNGRRTLELLLWHPHIDPNLKNDAQDTAFDIACRSGPLGALFEILEESVNVY